MAVIEVTDAAAERIRELLEKDDKLTFQEPSGNP